MNALDALNTVAKSRDLDAAAVMLKAIDASLIYAWQIADDPDVRDQISTASNQIQAAMRSATRRAGEILDLLGDVK